MSFAILLTAGAIVLSIALRSFEHPVLFRLGNLCMLAASYLLGFFITGHHAVGILCASVWFLLPWVDILTRVRRMRLPKKRTVKPQHPPNSSRFPSLAELTEEAEAEGFFVVEDAGWDHEEQRHSVRLLSHSHEPVRAAINLVEGEEFAFFYITVSSKTTEGVFWHTWNYPFSLSLRPSPKCKIQRVSDSQSFLEMLESHRYWLKVNKVTNPEPIPAEPEAITAELESEMYAQVVHNLNCGLLLEIDEHIVAYSWKGCFYLWFQFLKEFVRLK
jgi:hypothetical protein